MNYGKAQTYRRVKDLDSKSAKWGKKSKVIFLKTICIALLAVIIVVGCVGFGIIQGIISNAPLVTLDAIAPSGAATFIYDAKNNEIEKLAAPSSNRIYATLDQIPEDLQHAVVSIEDERFYDHNGIDIKGILRAFLVNVTSGNLSEGASTITQQLLKNNIFTDWTQESSLMEKFERKFQEQYLAIKIEQSLSKDVILENYLNSINLGSGSYGVQAAAHRYFNKDVSQLTLSESAVIAGITQNPTKFDPIVYPENNLTRFQKVLENMLDQGYITQAEFEDAIEDDVYSRIQLAASETEDTSVYTYYTDEVIEQVMEDLVSKAGYSENQAYRALFSGGLQIHTPQDSEIQQICDEEFSNPDNFPDEVEWYLEYALTVEKKDGTTENHSKEMLLEYFRENEAEDFSLLFSDQDIGLEYIEKYKEAVLETSDSVFAERIYFTAQPQASLVIIDQDTGYVKALVGGRGEKEASLTLNRATQTKRQPGSTFKILSTYAPAIDTEGDTLATVYDNAPYTYSDGTEVRNWDSEERGYSGQTNFRSSIESSVNVVTVKAFQDITPQLGYEYLLKFGITTLVEDDVVEALSLGGISDGVTNVELAAAYAAIANKGVYQKPIYYTKVLDQSGNVVLDNTADQETSTVIKESTAFLLTNAMEDVIKGEYGTARSLSLGDMPVAGKTGTTNDYKDLWFTGYTPYYTCSIWTGYDNNKILGGHDIYRDYNKILWKNIMSRVHENLPAKDFEIADGITTATICRKSGKLAVDGLCDQDPRGSMLYTEYFAAGTEPTDECDVHEKATVCSYSNMIANAYCPNKVTQVYFVLPRNASTETEDAEYQMPQHICSSHFKPKETEAPQSDRNNNSDDDDPGNNDNNDDGNNDGGNNDVGSIITEWITWWD